MRGELVDAQMQVERVLTKRQFMDKYAKDYKNRQEKKKKETRDFEGYLQDAVKRMKRR